MISILIYEKHDVVQRGLKSLIAEFWPLATVYVVDTLDKLWISLEKSINVLIADPSLEDINFSGFTKRVLIKRPECGILIYTSLYEDIYAIPFLKNGVRAFVSKSCREAEFITALTAVISGGRYANDKIKERLFNKVVLRSNEGNISQLSQREIVVANLLVKGHSVATVANLLNLNAGTVSTYKVRIFKKLNIKHIIQLSDRIKSPY